METRTPEETVAAIMHDGMGIAALDESPGTIGKKLEAVDMENAYQSRRQYRETLARTAEHGANRYVSAHIYHPEMIATQSEHDMDIPAYLAHHNILTVAKVDEGLRDLRPGSTEKITAGLSGLEERLAQYVELGAVATKWRSVAHISDELPSNMAVNTNALWMSSYAEKVLEAGMVPIVEPEVLMDGGTELTNRHDINKAYDVTARVLETNFRQIERLSLPVGHIILKSSFIVPGKNSEHQADDDTIAELTVRCFDEAVPDDIGGIVLLSGGMSPLQAAIRLNKINQIRRHQGKPFISFSFGRAIQGDAIKYWAEGSSKKAQQEFITLAKADSQAAKGEFTGKFTPPSEI